ncbi:hypothetical protein GGR57DRAFT_516176 [Xylariaceae sp. FL1272]|nr:hypothetical protein GGR57DRAFT_516176 [Xylariaceae sp. FL1272]
MPFAIRSTNRPISSSANRTNNRVVSNSAAGDAMALNQVTSTMKSLALEISASLMGLPIELRWEILRHVFGLERLHGEILVYNPRFIEDGISPQKLAVPSILLACKQIYREGIKIYWENRQIWLNGVTYRWEPRGKKLAGQSTSLYQLLPRLRNPIAANIRHIRGQNIQRWGGMDKGQARWLLNKFPNLKTFRLHGAAHVCPFWDDKTDQNQGVMELALRDCGAKLKFNNTREIVADFPRRVEFQVVIVITTIIPEDHDYYILYVNLNTGRHMFEAYNSDLEHLLLGHWHEDEAIWDKLRIPAGGRITGA